ncbi:chromosome transmission fidelity protein 8 homolog [Anthonomus grandis grandis]|uniref:chromosome transmission fidelity protein 8 homolog n=1 Tax=Anthonomus grandis grandis TaxID=2921223 RepID=UPI0021662EEE|nr:chromosome transmission fidelity protein 8 homolog [Anthonomus grandis grandis]
MDDVSRYKNIKSTLIKMPSDGATDEYGIIELQGDLKTDSENSFEGKFIGDLHYTKTGQPVLIIGYHLLYGKEAKIEKPVALLEKCKNEQGDTEYLVKCIIKKKIIFKTRPKPIVGAY